jgi:hypothetical protein
MQSWLQRRPYCLDVDFGLLRCDAVCIVGGYPTFVITYKATRRRNPKTTLDIFAAIKSRNLEFCLGVFLSDTAHSAIPACGLASASGVAVAVTELYASRPRKDFASPLLRVFKSPEQRC